jgi:hypothetical protein
MGCALLHQNRMRKEMHDMLHGPKCGGQGACSPVVFGWPVVTVSMLGSSHAGLQAPVHVDGGQLRSSLQLS